MQVTALPIEGAYLFTPVLHADERGQFCEWLRMEELSAALGHPFTCAQANLSVSARGVLRGVHFAAVPPGQGKYVTCPVGKVLDVVVDLRQGSPTFGRSQAVPLDAVHRQALYLAEGLGHAFLSLADGTVVTYLCSTPYTPAREFSVHPLDPELALPWPSGVTPVLSPRDQQAPGLQEALAAGLLPHLEACRTHRAHLAASPRP